MNIKQKEKQLRNKLRSLDKESKSITKELAHIEAIKSGDAPAPDQAKRIKTQKYSFGVHFVRAKELKKVRSPGKVCKSLRRFGTRLEALNHAKRFSKLHGHKSYEIVKVAKRANAWVNWRTGKTNPAINQ